MKIDDFPLSEAEGAINAHTVKTKNNVIKKGKLLTSKDLEQLAECNIKTVFAAKLEEGDIGENVAATRIANAICGMGLLAKPAITGRVNLIAQKSGLVMIDAEKIEAINLINESITIATLAPFYKVRENGLVATIKIIPFAVSETSVRKAEEIAAGMTAESQEDLAKQSNSSSAISVKEFLLCKAGLISTFLPNTPLKLLDKTVKVTSQRLDDLGAKLTKEIRCSHNVSAVQKSLNTMMDLNLDPIIIFGATATIDRRDIVPTAIQKFGGEIKHYGMPVDPGNLLLLAEYGEAKIIGAPGCARSPAFNGFDLVLQRILAGLQVTSKDISLLGVGGLFKEIETRPQPRQADILKEGDEDGISAIILAAGKSSRMGVAHKLLEDLEGKPLIRHAVEAVVESQVSRAIVVLGHRGSEVAAALDGLPVELVTNRNYVDGLSTSISCGVELVGEDSTGILVCLGDMPNLTASTINQIIGGFEPEENRSIVVPVQSKIRGNPVLFSTDFRQNLMSLKGDAGARHLVKLYDEFVCEVEVDANTFIDVDTPEALEGVRESRATNL